MATWRNWASTAQCSPSSTVRAASIDDVAHTVQRAAERHRRVKPVGSGHYFNDIAVTDDIQLNIDAISSVETVRGHYVTVGAGMTLHQLNRELDQRGLALPNLGDVAYQTVAGAIATATHGTGIHRSGIAAQVAAFDIVVGDGQLLHCSPNENAELFVCGRVGLGALGVITNVTFDCVDAFRLHAVEAPMPVAQIREEFGELVANNDHFEFFYVPHTDRAMTKRNNVTSEPARSRRFARAMSTYALENAAFGAICRVGRRMPSLIPMLARVVASGTSADYIGKSHEVFASPRLVRFVEMEYSLPLESCMAALDEVRSTIERLDLRVSFPIEVRVLGPDDIPLSTASGDDPRAYVAVHVYRKMDHAAYFAAAEAIFRSHGGRPHWGKCHTQSAETLAPLYEEWDRFLAARRIYDATGTFRNEHLDRVLGTP
jgi:FAD-linked oxidoreductase